MSSIRRRLALVMSAAAALLILAGGGGVYLALRHTLTAQFDADLLARAHALAGASEVEDGEFEIDSDVRDFAGFAGKNSGDAFIVLAPDGRTLARSPSLRGQHLPSLRPRRAGDSSAPVFASIRLPDDRAARAVAIVFTPRDDRSGKFPDLELVVAGDVARLNRTLTTSATVLGAVGAAGVVLTPLFVLAVLGAGLRPLRRLAADVQRVDLARRPRIPGDGLPAELAPVAAKLNELLARLEETFARERRFSGHAAHELRTPLAELKVMTELCLRWPEEFTPAHGQEMLTTITELEALLDKLALLARADSADVAHREAISPEEILADCLRPLAETIKARDLVVETTCAVPQIVTDRVLWRAIVANLTGNAVQHAPRGTRVVIAITGTELRVSNDAPDLAPEDREQMFERFWRKRRDLGPEKHVGLGLSIARSCAGALGGRCDAQLGDGRLTLIATWR